MSAYVNNIPKVVVCGTLTRLLSESVGRALDLGMGIYAQFYRNTKYIYSVCTGKTFLVPKEKMENVVE